MFPAFGWSVGDLVVAVRLTWKIIEAFREAGGAAQKYSQEVEFLQRVKRTLELLHRYVKCNPDDEFVADIAEDAKRIQALWANVAAYFEQYEASLGELRSANLARKSYDTVNYTLKDLSGKVQELKDLAKEPLDLIQMQLVLQVR